jgi:hypothetical protein
VSERHTSAEYVHLRVILHYPTVLRLVVSFPLDVVP